MYIHEHANWPDLRWDSAKLAAPLAEVRYLQGSLIGRMQSLGFPLREEAALQTLTQDVVKTSEIEGETLDTRAVRSAIARRMGIEVGGLPPWKRGQFLIKRGQFLILSTPRPASSGNTRDGSDNRMCPSSDARLIHPTVIVVSARKPAAKATFTEFPFGSLRLIRDRRR